MGSLIESSGYKHQILVASTCRSHFKKRAPFGTFLNVSIDVGLKSDGIRRHSISFKLTTNNWKVKSESAFDGI